MVNQIIAHLLRGASSNLRIRKEKKIIFLIFLSFLVSCEKPLYKRQFIVLGTYLEVISPFKEAGDLVYEEVKRLEKIFNFYDTQSELSMLNKTSNTKVKVSSELIEVLSLSKKIYQLTDGAFDISYGNLYNFWKNWIKNKSKNFPTQEEIENLKKLGGMENIEIDEENSTVEIKKEGLKIDLSGIATGYIIDRAVLILKEKGINSALINIGGDIYCLGKNQNRAWRVGIKDPISDGLISEVLLENSSITTSGNYEQFFEFKGKRHSHLISPFSGFPVENEILSVSVVAKNCVLADSLATAFFVMGLEKIKNFLEKNKDLGIKVTVITLDREGKHIYNF